MYYPEEITTLRTTNQYHNESGKGNKITQCLAEASAIYPFYVNAKNRNPFQQQFLAEMPSTLWFFLARSDSYFALFLDKLLVTHRHFNNQILLNILSLKL